MATFNPVCMWSNFHGHSNYCDGKGEIEMYVQKALDLSMISIGISSHAPLPFPCNWCMKPAYLNSYLSDLEKVRSQHHAIEIYCGLEVDYIPDTVGPKNFRNRLDYTVGSIHFVEQFEDGTPWEIDGPHQFFLEGFEKIFRQNARETLTRYFELTREMISNDCPTLVGHLDKIKIQNLDNKLFHEQDAWYQQEIKRTVDLIGQSCAIVEVNTRGLYQKKSATTYPSPWVLEYIHQKKIPIALSSDAHHPDDLINQFDSTASLLKQIGFKNLSTLHEGRWQSLPFNEHGIILR